MDKDLTIRTQRRYIRRLENLLEDNKIEFEREMEPEGGISDDKRHD